MTFWKPILISFIVMIILGVLGMPKSGVWIIGFIVLLIVAAHYIGREKRINRMWEMRHNEFDERIFTKEEERTNKETIDHTPEEVGKLLFDCACKLVSEDLNKSEFHNLKSIRNMAKSKSLFDIELLITILYAAANSVWINRSSEDKAYRIFDSMYAGFANLIQTANVKLAVKNIDKQLYLMSRHKEYDDAQQEKRGPNKLWPLSLHIIKNLLGKETVDIEDLSIQDITAITIYYTVQVRFFNDIIKEIQVKN